MRDPLWLQGEAVSAPAARDRNEAVTDTCAECRQEIPVTAVTGGQVRGRWAWVCLDCGAVYCRPCGEAAILRHAPDECMACRGEDEAVDRVMDHHEGRR